MTSVATVSSPNRLKWDALQITLAVLVFLQVWRIQALLPRTPLFGVPVLATLSAVFLFWLDRDPRRRLLGPTRPIVRVSLGILALVALSIPGSLYPRLSVSFLLKDYLRSVALMLLLAGSIRGLGDLRRLAWVQIVGVTLCAMAVATRAQVGLEGRLSVDATVYYDANDLATLIVCTLPFVLYLWPRPTGLGGRLVLAAATVFLLKTLGETGSRGGFLGFAAVAGYLVLRFRGLSGVKRLAAVAVLVLLLVGLASESYFARIETMLHPSSDYNWEGQSETGRVEIWRRGISYMLAHPVLGVGAATFARAEGTLAPEAQARRRYGHYFRQSTAHNSFIQIGAEIGLLGLILFGTLLFDAFRTLAVARRGLDGDTRVLAQVLTASLVAFVVTACFLSQAYSAYLYTLLGMILGLDGIASPPGTRLPLTGSVLGRFGPEPGSQRGPFPSPAD
jgi:O-antigen ligase